MVSAMISVKSSPLGVLAAPRCDRSSDQRMEARLNWDGDARAAIVLSDDEVQATPTAAVRHDHMLVLENLKHLSRSEAMSPRTCLRSHRQ
jgi:hypothetical protein